jgi:hypothetical protein
VTDGLALLTSCLLDLRQLTAGHIPEIGVLQMVFNSVDQVREQSKLKVSRPFQLFLRQVPLVAQAEIFAVKPLGGLHHRDAMIGVILLRNGNIHTAAFLPSGVLHQLLDLAAQVARDRDAFFDHSIHLLSAANQSSFGYPILSRPALISSHSLRLGFSAATSSFVTGPPSASWRTASKGRSAG